VADLERGINEAMKARGLSPEDLRAVDGVSTAMVRFREAKHQPPKEAAAAQEAVLAEIGKVKIDARFLRKKLDRVEEALKSVPEDKRSAYESRYLDLAGSALRRGQDEAAYAELSGRISQLERDLARLSRPAGEAKN
jgi:hypothetical protein